MDRATFETNKAMHKILAEVFAVALGYANGKAHEEYLECECGRTVHAFDAIYCCDCGRKLRKTAEDGLS